MKTKTIFKTVALAMLMPAMLLTTACSNDDDVVNNAVNTENTINKGYALPVTVNVTRGDGATRASYNESTRKLEFSTGDQLFVEGSHIDADRFAGTLTWQSGGTFSGTIYTESPYEGTIDDLLNGNYATLLPAGYEGYDYLEIIDEGYEALLGENAYNSFATSKKLGVEQLSFEHGEYTSGTGFVLEPRNAILNFTITGLTPSTKVTAALSDYEDWTPDIEGEVTTDGSGNATFAIGLEGSSDLNKFSLTVAGNAITLVSSSKVLEAGKIYNITRGPGKFTINSSGDQVYFSQGNLQATTTDGGTNWTWAFAAHQWDYVGNATANTSINGNGTVSANGTVDLFYWSTASTYYGIHNSTEISTFSGDFKDWGILSISNGGGYTWRTLTSAEWKHIFNDRTSGATVNGTTNARWTHATINTDGTPVNGIILFPDGCNINSSSATWGTINDNDNSDWGTKCTTAQWTHLEELGCVFLPAAGSRSGSVVSSVGEQGVYWSATPTSGTHAYLVEFFKKSLNPTLDYWRNHARSVRLVRDVAAAAPANKLLSDATAEDIGKVVGVDGKIYANVAAAQAASTTACAIIAYVGNGSDCTNGLALQLNASPESKDWNDAKTYASGLTAVPGGTWRLPSKADWQNMFVGCAKSGDAGAGDTMNPIAGFKEKIGATGITWKTGLYWSRTDSGSNAWRVNVNLNVNNARASFSEDDTSNPYYVLGCLAF